MILVELKQKNREEISENYKWNLNSLVASDDAWQQGMDKIGTQLKSFTERYKGNLKDLLAECLTERAAMDEAFERLYVYATMKHHEDTTKYQDFADMASRLHVELMTAESFIEPEILTLDESKLQAVELEPFRHYLNDLLRQKEHVMSAEVEAILAQAQEVGQGASDIFDMLDNADIKFGTVTDEDGNQVELTHSRYGALLSSPDRALRKTVWHTYYDSYMYLKNTLASTYAASVKKDVFFAKARNYPSAMEAALSSNNIPKTVYTGLIDTVHEFLPQMHRYMKLRKKALQLSELQVYDLYTPMVKQVNDNVKYEDAVETVLKSLAPLGEAYQKASEAGLKGGWIDVYENAGKMSGAYSWGAYGGHPYILMNYENKTDDMFTLTHELGHAMHSYYSWGNQPYIYGDYTIFLAEVASTVNEALLMEHLLKNTTDPAMTAYLTNTWLEQFRTTVFRQTLFAEFEMITHQMVEAGEPLTLEALNKVYRGLNEKYYGSELILDDKLDLEWARIPHFYRAFYVYQYATGYSAAMAFAKRILAGGDGVEKYLAFLKSGSSEYSIDILKKAGVDMSQPAPIKEALEKFGDLIGEMERIL